MFSFTVILLVLFTLSITETVSNSSSQFVNKTVSNYTSLFLTSNITTLNDNNFDHIIKNGKVNPYIVLFTVKKCTQCNQIIEIMENVTKILNDTNSSIVTAKIDCFASSWTAMRFSIDIIPQIAYISNGTIRYMNNSITSENIFSFIEGNNSTKPIPIPRPMDYIGVGKKIFSSLNRMLTDYMNEKGITWNAGLTAGSFIGGFALLAIIEWKFVSCCCKSKRKEHHHIHGFKSGFKKGKKLHKE